MNIQHSILFANFDDNQSTLKQMHSNSLDELIRFLNNYSEQEMRIELIQGHAASSEANAEELSLRRAQVV